MRFALLGTCSSSLSLARSVKTSRRHQLALICAAATDQGELKELCPDIQPPSNWELLLADGVADALIVASDDSSETRNDQLRKLVQAGIPLLLVHPACDAMVAYELEMIAEQSGCVLFPFVRGQRHKAVTQATEIVNQAEQSSIGVAEQIVVEHYLDDRCSSSVLSSLSRDAGLLLPIAGRFDEIGAFGPESHERNYSALSVNMSRTAQIPVRWSVVPAAELEGTVATFVGTRGRLILNMLGDPTGWSLQPAPSTEPANAIEADAESALSDFERALAGESEPSFSWSDACRTLELQTAVRESLRRGRKTKLYDDQYSEQQTFKGKMAVGGCSLLLLALVILFGFAVYDVITLPFRDKAVSPADDPAEPSLGLWLRLWPAYPLIVFLSLQLLKLVFWNDRHSTPHSQQS